jgi:glycosyltransferase involved in cell wall biosynthesis
VVTIVLTPSRRRIVVLTTGQPATSPRVTKEADALASAGHDVRVIGTYWVDWAVAADARGASDRAWSYHMLDWRRESNPWLFWKSRARHRAAVAAGSWPLVGEMLLDATAGRTTPELTQLALEHPADLYIAHTLGALPAAGRAAARHSALFAFDAEDFHSGQFAHRSRDRRRRLAQRVEQRFIPRCDYVTAASPAIAQAYAPLRRTPPQTLLNVFPLHQRPSSHRPLNDHGRLTLYWCSQTIGPHRGLEDAVRAMGVVGSAVELHLQGKCWPGYQEQLRALAAAAGVARHLIVFHPPAAPEQLACAAAAYDVGLAIEPPVSVNNELLLSNKVFTYLLAGLAIVATRTIGQDWLRQHTPEAVKLYDSGNVDALAGLLRHWINKRSELAAARAAAWRYGSERYNWDYEQCVLLDLVDALFAGRVEQPQRTAAPAPLRRVTGGTGR